MPTTVLPTLNDVDFLRSLKIQNFLHFSDGTTFKGFINKDPNDPMIKGIWGEAALHYWDEWLRGNRH